MKNYFFLCCLILAISVISGCKSKKKPASASSGASTAVRTEDSLLVSLEKTYCYGTCPVYKFQLYRDGYVKYKGIEHTPLKGDYYGFLEDSDRTDILRMAIQLNILDLKDSYVDQGVTDLPTTILTLRLGSKVKRIETMGLKPPDEFITFDKYLEGVIKQIYFVQE